MVSPTYRRLRVPLTPAQRGAYGWFRPTGEVRDAWRSTRGRLAAGGGAGAVSRARPGARPPQWGQPRYDRLHGRGRPRSSYSDADLEELRRRVGAGPAYVLFNNAAHVGRCPSLSAAAGGTGRVVMPDAS